MENIKIIKMTFQAENSSCYNRTKLQKGQNGKLKLKLVQKYVKKDQVIRKKKADIYKFKNKGRKEKS